MVPKFSRLAGLLFLYMALLLVKCPSTGCLRTDISKPGPGERMVLWVGDRGYPIAEMDAKLRDRDSAPQPGGQG